MGKQFLVETSARHLHVSKEDFAILFGPDAKLSVKKELSQPGQYASNERVTIVGTKGELKNVTILGPERKKTQIEISATDARSIGIPIIIRESGDIVGTGSCKIVGPAGEIELKEGVIVAKRHIHFSTQDAKEFGVENSQIVWVKIETPDRKTIFGDVVIRVSDDFATAMHIDTDESNAAGCFGQVFGEIVNI